MDSAKINVPTKNEDFENFNVEYLFFFLIHESSKKYCNEYLNMYCIAE